MIYWLTDLEDRSLRSRCGQGGAPSGGFREGPSCLSQPLVVVGSPGIPWLVAALLQSLSP